MVLASEYLPTLQIILICCVLAPIHWPWGSVATQPSVVLAIRPFLGWQDGFGCWISVTVLDTLSQIRQPDILSDFTSRICATLEVQANWKSCRQEHGDFPMLNKEGSSSTVQLSCSELWLPDLPSRLNSTLQQGNGSKRFNHLCSHSLDTFWLLLGMQLPQIERSQACIVLNQQHFSVIL